MCDTFIASPTTTRNRAMLFAKNSDRQRNEAQTLELWPSADHPPNAEVACTYITIPQVRRTHAVLLCRPFWMWGAEIAVNERGVAIGNETVHSRSAPPEEPALIGMDLVRLSLERAATAAEALDVITDLLERYGQGGDCGHMVPFYYNNSFMIADPTEAFVLETIGREWLVERAGGVRAISNCYSIQEKLEKTSPGLNTMLRQLGWSSSIPSNYAAVIADRQREDRGDAHSRQTRAAAALLSREGDITVGDAVSVLRDHGPSSEAEWSPRKVLPYGLCAHAGPDDRSAQTTNSLVSELRLQNAVHWVTGTAAPCISLFKPLMMDVPLPIQGRRPSGAADWDTLWWRHERLHRAALLGDFPKFLCEISGERDAVEAQLYARMAEVIDGGTPAERARAIAQCWQEAEQVEERWLAKLEHKLLEGNSRYTAAWLRMNRVAGVTDPFLLSSCESPV
jgi:secernin